LRGQNNTAARRSNKIMSAQEIEESDCGVCMRPLADTQRIAIIESCGHLFCLSCISNNTNRLQCPTCNVGFSEVKQIDGEGETLQIIKYRQARSSPRALSSEDECCGLADETSHPIRKTELPYSCLRKENEEDSGEGEGISSGIDGEGVEGGGGEEERVTGGRKRKREDELGERVCIAPSTALQP
jgi:hypothetical protein